MAEKTGKRHKSSDESETGSIHKSWRGRIRIALVYPNTYYVGMSNLGFQAVYHLLNSIDSVVCERVFLPERNEYASGGLITEESKKNVAEFDIVAFSISFENDYLNVVSFLKKAGFPLLSADRGDPHPLIIAGGVACFLNPEPIAPFIDCFLIGEAEAILPDFINNFDPATGRNKCLTQLAKKIPGVYVPSFYKTAYKTDGTIESFNPIKDVPAKIKRACYSAFSENPAFSAVITPATEFADTFLMELSRGCPHGCRFCAAGYVYRPPRFSSLPALETGIAMAANMTRKIGLVGAAASDHPGINHLCDKLNQSDIRATFSSLRADSLTPELIASLHQSKTKTATIAPDAGSQRMRDIINKGLTEQDILEATENLVTSGIPNLKLYFMIGLPAETPDDIEAIVDLCVKIKTRFLAASRPRKRIGRITVNINTFIPKPFTPFQWSPMDNPRSLKNKITTIKNSLARIANMTVNIDNPKKAYIQALLARGDRRISDILIRAVEHNENWSKILKDSPINTDFYVLRERTETEYFPWDFIDHGIRKSFLFQEYKKALKAKSSPPCPIESCNLCGVCGQNP